MIKPVAILCARSDSVYRRLPGCDVFDLVRDAWSFRGGKPVVAHPPCRLWGELRHGVRLPWPSVLAEVMLGGWCVMQAAACGGVVEQPLRSQLFERFRPGCGFFMNVPQMWFGHRAEKQTRLLICGCRPVDVPRVELVLGDAERVITNVKSRPLGHPLHRAEVTRAEREATPLSFATWLLDVARRCAP